MALGMWGQRSGGPANPQELNRYSYVNNNPLNTTDPSGHCGGGQCTLAGAAAGGMVAGPPGAAVGATVGGIADILTFVVAAVLVTAVVVNASDNLAAPVASEPPPLQAGDAGSYDELKGAGQKGDELEVHHIPQAALGHTGYGEGGAIALPKGEHKQTRTYGPKGRRTAAEDAGESFRDVVAKDIRDLRRIAGSKYNQGAKKLLDYYRQKFPDKMKKE